MICRTCRHCGLCEGDGTFAYDKNLSVEQNIFSADKLSEILCVKKDALSSDKAESDSVCKESEISFNQTDIGIAFDIGTTTIAAAVFSLHDNRLLFTTGEQNLQSEFGADVIARLSFASTKDGYDALHKIILIQINDIVRKILARLAAENLSNRKQMPVLKKIVIAGNTVMESLAYGEDVSSLGTFPFTVNNKFGVSVKASSLFNANSSIPSECRIFFAPVVSAFVGGDSICAVTSCISQSNKNILLADLGTNCEILFYDSQNDCLTCTSAAAGPAFECQTIECGMRCTEGAVVSTEYSKKSDSLSGTFIVKTAGGSTAQGICGTGLVSAAAQCIKNNLITKEGAINQNADKIIIVPKNDSKSQKEIFITQKDIRNLQLAKGAVKAGMEILLENCNVKSAKEISLFIAGGFGSSLNVNDLQTIRMFPENTTSEEDASFAEIFSAGNASLSGASLILLSEKIKKQAIELSAKAVNIDLAQYPDFQKKFISSLNF